MRVIATKRGFFDGLREPGDEFEVPQGASGNWFDPVEKPEVKKAPKPKAEPKAPLEGEKADDLV